MLDADYGAKLRAVAAGLLKTKNADAAGLLRPLLASPYEELRTDAMLALGRLGDPQALSALRKVVASPDRHRPALVALASWHVLKAAGTAPTVARSLAPLVK
jgi:HEAT repeat protein